MVVSGRERSVSGFAGVGGSGLPRKSNGPRPCTGDGASAAGGLESVSRGAGLSMNSRKAIILATLVVLFLVLGAASAILFWPPDPAKQGLLAYQNGDYATAYRVWLSLAEGDQPVVQNNLALLYRDGRGVRADPAEAARWFTRAAEKGLARAQVNLGAMYAVGQGVSQDDVEAAKWFRLAAAQGDSFARYDLVDLYRRGRVKAENLQEVAEWYRAAALDG